MAARIAVVVAVLAVLAGSSACADAPSSRPAAVSVTSAPAAEATTVTVAQVPASPVEPGVGALEPSYHVDIETFIRDEHPSFGPAKVRRGDLVPGGPGPDGIPSIDEPRFHRVDAADFPADYLRDNEPVYVLRVGDDVRAYPLQVMIWHEIVNDTVGGIPVAVTYCPLCNSAFAFDRRHAGRVLSFGVSGFLHDSALVMFDRQTMSLWSHFAGEALLGRLAGGVLEEHPVTLASWAAFRRAHPRALVLSRDTGFDKDYGRNPYPGYDDIDNPPFLFDGVVDGRYAAKTRLVGVDLDGTAVAVTHDRLRADRVVPVTIAGRELVVVWQPGTASALDTRQLAAGRDVGTSAVFDVTLDGRILRFEPVPGTEGFRDVETGTTWDIFGTAVAGPLAGRRLTAVPHVDTFWFAWAAFRPATTIVG